MFFTSDSKIVAFNFLKLDIKFGILQNISKIRILYKTLFHQIEYS